MICLTKLTAGLRCRVHCPEQGTTQKEDEKSKVPRCKSGCKWY